MQVSGGTISIPDAAEIQGLEILSEDQQPLTQLTVPELPPEQELELAVLLRASCGSSAQLNIQCNYSTQQGFDQVQSDGLSVAEP